MSLQERTLVVKNFDPEKTTYSLLKELCLQGGPVRNVVLKPDHAFVEYEDIESVGYTKALLDGIELFGKKLIMEPKTRTNHYFRYTQILRDYENFDKQQQQALQRQQQMMEFWNQQSQLYSSLPNLYPQANFVPASNPQMFEYNPFSQQLQAQFIQPLPNQLPPPEPPSTSLPRQNDNFRRSRSFRDHRHGGQFNRSHSERAGDWVRRR